MANKTKRVTKKEMLTELQEIIVMCRDSHCEPDGVVRDQPALHTIACLREARKIIGSSTPATRNMSRSKSWKLGRSRSR